MHMAPHSGQGAEAEACIQRCHLQGLWTHHSGSRASLSPSIQYSVTVFPGLSWQHRLSESSALPSHCPQSELFQERMEQRGGAFKHDVSPRVLLSAWGTQRLQEAMAPTGGSFPDDAEGEITSFTDFSMTQNTCQLILVPSF